MRDEEFEKIINEAIESLPAEFLSKLENVSIVIQDYPKAVSRGYMLLGLYEGIPKTRRGHYGIGATLPDKITIFKYPMLSIARSFSDLKEIVKNTVWHEIAHHFGMDESAVRQAEKARIERLSKRRLYLKQ